MWCVSVRQFITLSCVADMVLLILLIFTLFLEVKPQRKSVYIVLLALISYHIFSSALDTFLSLIFAPLSVRSAYFKYYQHLQNSTINIYSPNNNCKTFNRYRQNTHSCGISSNLWKRGSDDGKKLDVKKSIFQCVCFYIILKCIHVYLCYSMSKQCMLFVLQLFELFKLWINTNAKATVIFRWMTFLMGCSFLLAACMN